MTEPNEIEALIEQARTMVRESGDLENFDSDAGVRQWLERPLPALGGRAPREFMATAEGRARISDLLAQQQSGAYA
ncbi:MAG: DUF2384 domain-containing protein [Proteobacteria bacterium]|nr:DUF2384 domain-containing protein [Pseudomonadota bacterium]